MSQSKHAAYLRAGTKMGGLEFIDTMLKDGLWDAFHGYHMGNTAENVARAYQITREEQDAFALGSQHKASAAQKSGRFKDEIAPVTVQGRKGDTVVSDDEYIRHDANAETMAKLRPAFSKDGTVTAGNASGINDGGCRTGADDGVGSRETGSEAAGAHRRVCHRRRRSGGDGHRTDPVHPQGAEPGGLETGPA